MSRLGNLKHLQIQAFVSGLVAIVLSLVYPNSAWGIACAERVVSTQSQVGRPKMAEIDYVSEAFEHALVSSKRDGTRVKHLAPGQRRPYEIVPDGEGSLTFSESGKKIFTGAGETLIFVWSTDENRSGPVYGVKTEATRDDMDNWKHSSFNYNKPVLGAWMSSTDTHGKLKEIIDGSGHYEPTPLHMYFIAKHLQELGFDLSEAHIVFEYGLDEIRGLKVPAIEFISAMQELTPEQRQSFEAVGYSRSKLIEFMGFIRKHTDDPWTIVLLDLFAVRNFNAQNSQNSLENLAKYASAPAHRGHLTYLLEAIFKMRIPRHFAGYPAYWSLPQESFASTYEAMQRLFLTHITSSSIRSEVEKWMIENRIGPPQDN